MQTQGRIQQWGDSAALRLPAKLLAAAGFKMGSEVAIRGEAGRVIIQLHERDMEPAYERLLTEEPGAAAWIALAKDKLAKAITLTDDTTERCYSLIERLENRSFASSDVVSEKSHQDDNEQAQ
ncbi:MAG: hypothetical protein AB2784_19975 [Candidatus Thiodiazotropha endolucinida]